MAWVVTKQLEAFRAQMNATFPNRDKASDGTIGDYLHQQEKSGHNPDDTAQNNAEWDGDSDSKQEVRAIDIDSDTGNPNVSAEDIVQHLLKLARAGQLWFIRYMIYNRRIWSASNNWNQQTYTGSSPHTEHIHLSGAYSDTADEYAAADYKLDEIEGVDMPLTGDDVSAIWNAQFGPSTNRVSAGSLLVAARDNAVDANTRAQALATAVAAIAAKVDLDPAEIAAIKAAIEVPTPEENAQAVVDALGGIDVSELVSLLNASLTPDKVAELKAAL